MFKKQLLFLTLILLLGACAPTPQPTPDNILVPPATDTPTENPIAQANGCPTATAGLKLMVDTESGFCMLYPAEFTWIRDGSSFVILNPNPPPNDIPGEAWLNVEVSAAGGQTAAQIVDAELTALGEGFNITRTELTIDGKPAILVDGLPAFDVARFVYIVNNDRLYRFDFLPWFPKDGTTPLEKLYQSVVATLHFLPTSGAASAPENGCPTETADLKLLVNTEDGYCLLYPAEFTWDGSSMVVLNPNPPPGDIPGDAWLTMEVSDAGGKTAAQIVDAELAALGEGFTITHPELTIDGKPAILVDGLPAFDVARFVYIVNNDRLYRFGFLPWFPDNGTTPLEKLYQSVVDSLHFLPTRAAESAALNECPAETETLKQLVNTEDRYCLLYPAGLGLLPPRLIVINPNNMPGDVPGDAWLDVLVSGAEGQTAAQIADAKIAEWGEGFNITRTELTIDGKPAILVDGLPAQDPMRTVFIVHKDMLYRFEFMPWSLKDGTTPLEKLYQSVVDTLHFLP